MLDGCTVNVSGSDINSGTPQHIGVTLDCADTPAAHAHHDYDSRFKELYNILALPLGSDDDPLSWMEDGIDFCDVQLDHHLRHPEHGSSTLAILINCSWLYDEDSSDRFAVYNTVEFL